MFAHTGLRIDLFTPGNVVPTHRALAIYLDAFTKNELDVTQHLVWRNESKKRWVFGESNDGGQTFAWTYTFDDSKVRNCVSLTMANGEQRALEIGIKWSEVDGIFVPTEVVSTTFETHSHLVRRQKSIRISDAELNREVSDDDFSYHALQLKNGTIMNDKRGRYIWTDGEWISHAPSETQLRRPTQR